MSENFQTQKNTVATVGMRFSIIGLIALITIIFSRFSFPLLFVGFVLGIIGLFYKPRTKARVAVCIPLVVFITIASIIGWFWSSIKTPTMQFVDWTKVEFANIDEENFDKDRFNAIANEEFNNMLGSIDEEELTAMIENNTGSNILEKLAYTVFGLGQQGLENSLEKYNNGYVPEISDDNNQIITVDVDIEKDEESENVEENSEDENVAAFTQSEQNDIEQVLSILE